KMIPGLIVNEISKDLKSSAMPSPMVHLTRSTAECRCLICGKFLGLLTHCHAEKHGYKNKQEMIDDGKIEFLHKRGTHHED
ncbi:hypothetical protein, partial [Pelorhabdus rhamnosifermentans]|uniref:hypothetical protein n=1 Tax=Pelorhabdus rhamnosifermentans TaxID=2772457 RepID=UPI001C063A92